MYLKMQHLRSGVINIFWGTGKEAQSRGAEKGAGNESTF